MSVALSDLVNRLREDVPVRNDVPSEMQYEQAVRDAVSDFNRRASMRKIATLSLVSGTAAYSLPADFVRLIRLESLTTPDLVLNTPTGLIPVSANYEERHTIAGLTITFHPTPAYTLDRDLEYAAGHVVSTVDGASVYAEMTDDAAAIVALKAQALALTWQANAQARFAMSYQIGDERVSKEKLAEALRAQAQALTEEYLSAVTAHVGVVAVRARY